LNQWSVAFSLLQGNHLHLLIKFLYTTNLQQFEEREERIKQSSHQPATQTFCNFKGSMNEAVR